MRLGLRLTLSHVLLVLLCLILLSGGSWLVITRAQRDVNLQRALDATTALAESLRTSPVANPNLPDILTRLRHESERLNGRILLLNAQGVIVTDTVGGYEGERIPMLPLRMQRVSSARRHTFQDGQEHFLVTAKLNEAQRERFGADSLAVAVKVADVNPPWRAIVPLLGGIALGVIALAILLAYAISKSVTRPVSAMTRAAESMAQGDFSQRIPTQGRDEIAQLAVAFNSMSEQVAQSQRTQRDFLANVSHDLRTPLTSVQGFSQAILEGAITDADGYKRAATIIQQESLRMQNLVDDLLELARLESGELRYDAQPVSPTEMLVHEIRRHKPKADARGIHFALDLTGNVPHVHADGTRLAQVWANLLGNAVRYAREGSTIRIAGDHWHGASGQVNPNGVRFGAYRTDQGYARISVGNLADDLDGKELPRLFERFYRGDRSRAHSEGTGLGLSIVRQTVLAHHGVLEASLSEGELEVSVSLPVETNPQS